MGAIRDLLWSGILARNNVLKLEFLNNGFVPYKHTAFHTVKCFEPKTPSSKFLSQIRSSLRGFLESLRIQALVIPHSRCHNPNVPHASLIPSSDWHSCKYHMDMVKVACSVSFPMKYLNSESSILYFLFFLPILHSCPWISLSHYRMKSFEKVSEGLITSLSLSPH